MAAGGVACLSTSSSPAAAAPRAQRRGRGRLVVRCGCVAAGGSTAEEHYRTLQLPHGATKGEVKKAFRRLALTYHPDVSKESDDGGVQFQRISVAYQMVMDNMREAEERLEYWRLKYGLTDQDLDKYRCYLNDDDDDDDWFDL